MVCLLALEYLIMEEGPKYGLIHAKEGVCQGDLPSMALYGVALLPLVEKLKRAVPEDT